MSSDISRQRFDSANDFSAVLMQQGRVLLDSDWNELIEILDRRLRAETIDIIGRGVVPKETPHGFEIAIAAGKLTIGPGRIYVDGLLAENHGAAPTEFDPVLAELRGTAALPYDQQPYLPDAANGAPAPNQGGPHLVFLDVWQREVTWLEDPRLVESAVGVDSTTRWQTVWQVRVLPNVGANATCATPDAQIPGWLDIIHPSAGRLTTDTVAVPPSDDLCLIPPSGGYRGLENRLYRVEIHNAGGVGGAGAATFKWARHNASIATAVRQIKGEDLVVDLIGRDAELRFKTGDWVEITDDVREFAGQPGEMRKIKNVTDTTRTITIDGVLPVADFPTDANNNTDAARHVRVRRWEQKGQVRDANGSLVVDLDAVGSQGVIPVPAPGTVIVLEDGITVALSVVPAGEKFRVGDYWVFVARASDASVEKLKQAPPRGIHHHYCRLGLVTFPATVTDCRVFWPPDFGGHECCDCTVCVTVESHNSGTLTIQQAIDQVRERGGTVCLDVGIYNIGEAGIRIDGARSLRVRGQGWKTILAHVAPGPAIVAQNSFGLTIENLTVLTAGAVAAPADVSLANSAAVAVERCWFLQAGSGDRAKPAIGLGGFLVHTRLRDNVFLGAIGIGNLATEVDAVGAAPKTAPLLTLGFSAERNQMLCARAGISLERLSLHLGETRAAGNFIDGAANGGIRFTGAVLGGAFPGSHLEVADNTLKVAGDGIVTATDDTRINGNDISPVSARKSANGIVLASGVIKRGGDRGQVIGNRINGLEGDGIAITASVGSLMIKQNVVTGVGGGGIVMSADSSAENLSLENNQLLDVAQVTASASESLPFLAGIHLVRVRHGDIVGNILDRVAVQASLIRRLAGIQVLSPTRVRISGNRIANLGPPAAQLRDVAGIAVLGSFEEAVVSENSVRRADGATASDGSFWRALRIGQPVGSASIGGALVIYGKTIEAVLGTITGFVRPLASEQASVRGNAMVIFGAAPAIQIIVLGACTIGENQVRILPDTRAPALVLSAFAAIVSGNFLSAARGDLPAAEINTGNGPFTVLGNITSGIVRVNNATLGAPWQPLNVVAP